MTRDWLHEQLSAQAWSPERCRVHVLAALHGQELVRVMAARAQGADPHGKSTLLLLAACESSIDEAHIAELEASGRLHTALNQQGDIPGESAAALLLVKRQPGAPLHPEALAVFSAGAMAQREQPAEQGKANARTLTELVAGQLAAQAIAARQIGTVVSDADHRGCRVTEQSLLITELFEHLDAVKDTLAAGQALGTLGSSASLLPLVMGCAECRDAQTPVLVLSVADALQRSATLVRPALDPEPVAI